MSSARFSPTPSAWRTELVTPPSGSACATTCGRRNSGVCAVAMLLAAASSPGSPRYRPDKAKYEREFLLTVEAATGAPNFGSPSAIAAKHRLDAAHRLANPRFVLDQREAHILVAEVAEADAGRHR